MTKREAQRRRRQRRLQTVRNTVIATLVLLAFLWVVGRAGWYECHYWREAQVISVENQLVKVEDKAGYRWTFSGEGYRVGDEVEMLMFNNTTDSIISDDEIEEVKLVTDK
jgi:hypothetical protein